LQQGIYLPNHSRSIEAYQTWASSPAAEGGSGHTTPLPNTKLENTVPPTAADITSRIGTQNEYPTLPVITQKGKKMLPCLVTPKNFAGQRLKYAIYEFEQLIDSSEIGLDDFVRIATGEFSDLPTGSRLISAE